MLSRRRGRKGGKHGIPVKAQCPFLCTNWEAPRRNSATPPDSPPHCVECHRCRGRGGGDCAGCGRDKIHMGDRAPISRQKWDTLQGARDTLQSKRHFVPSWQRPRANQSFTPDSGASHRGQNESRFTSPAVKGTDMALRAAALGIRQGLWWFSEPVQYLKAHAIEAA